MSTATSIDRKLVEQIVREIVLKQVGGPCGRPNLVVSISARHCHLTDEHVEKLFGAGHKLTVFKEDEINLETAFMALTKGITA